MSSVIKWTNVYPWQSIKSSKQRNVSGGGGLGLKRLSDYIGDVVKNNNNTIIILKKFVSHSKVLVSVQGLKNN